jgi:predicted nuclease with RNAse H fold
MKIFVGIDVQESRGCCFAALGDDGVVFKKGWFSDPGKEACQLVKSFKEKYDVSVGIDSPRMPLILPRNWYWDGNGSRWRSRRPAERGYGRHCEIAVRVHRLANPQYTPLDGEAPQWMITGFKVFSALQNIVPTYEVFPTASYSLLYGIIDVQICIDFASCDPGPKDMLDAFVAAATVREFVCGRGTEVGGGDGLGTIILPRPLRQPIIKEVLDWPEVPQKYKSG